MSLATATNSSQWFIPRFVNSFLDAVDQQALEYMENVESIKNGTFTGKELEFPTFIRILQNLNYFISPYAAACMIMAIILNRTLAFASSNGTISINSFNKFIKSSLRVLTILLLSNSLIDVLKVFARNYEYFNNYLIKFNIPLDLGEKVLISSLLWKIFISFCISNFIETLISVNSGQLPFYDTALTLFEHSLAFQESRYSRLPSAQLLIILISSILNQIIVQLFGLFNLKKYQLIPSTFFSLNLIGICVFNFFNNSISKIPIILILSIIPQIIVLSISSICLLIYSLAVLINGTTQGLIYTPMLANLSQSLNLQLNEDFNSLITRFGIIMFNALDNDDYINEFHSINFQTNTYLDKKNYLLSNYFNKFDKIPLSLKSNLQKKSSSIATIWSLFKKYINVFNLIKSFFHLIFKLLFNRNSSSNLNVDNNKLNINPDDTITTIEQLNNSIINEIYEDDNDDFLYQPDFESDLESLEYDSDYQDDDDRPKYLGTIQEQRNKEVQITKSSRPINELFQTNDILSILNPSSEDFLNLSYLKFHLLNTNHIRTRSNFSKLNEDELLKDLIFEKRSNKNQNNEIFDSNEDEDDQLSNLECVVCQTNARNIIIWPCKCFAICENCRLSLGVRGFSHCVCCRRQVDGFSKVYIP